LRNQYIVDDRSGVAYQEYRCVYGEDVVAALRFLFNAMTAKTSPDFPLQGIPLMIYCVQKMNRHPLELLIEKADHAIIQEDFDTLMDIYCHDAVLVIKPGMNASGKVEIRKAMEAIAAHFSHTLHVQQAGMKILEAGDTALVIAKTVVSASNMPAMVRNATYVFAKDSSGEWRCKIDNSYEHELLLHENA